MTNEPIHDFKHLMEFMQQWLRSLQPLGRFGYPAASSSLSFCRCHWTASDRVSATSRGCRCRVGHSGLSFFVSHEKDARRRGSHRSGGNEQRGTRTPVTLVTNSRPLSLRRSGRTSHRTDSRSSISPRISVKSLSTPFCVFLLSFTMTESVRMMSSRSAVASVETFSRNCSRVPRMSSTRSENAIASA